MLARRIAALVGVGSLLTGCNLIRPKPATEIRTGEVVAGKRWNATLSTPTDLAGAVQVRGSAFWEPGTNSGNTRARINISNATPGGVHPWHVHQGRCGSNGAIVGAADVYKPIRVDGEGRGSEAAVVPVPLPDAGEYYVNVHASPSNMATIVACGNLAPPSS